MNTIFFTDLSIFVALICIYFTYMAQESYGNMLQVYYSWLGYVLLFYSGTEVIELYNSSWTAANSDRLFLMWREKQTSGDNKPKATDYTLTA